MTVDLGQEVKIVSIFLINQNNGSARMNIGLSHFRHGNDASQFSMQNTKVVDNVTDGGFFEASPVLSKRYLSLRRDERPP